jgi:hypothetical protein
VDYAQQSAGKPGFCITTRNLFVSNGMSDVFVMNA